MLLGQNVKNRFINSEFDFWQRNTSFNFGNVYTADRWFMALQADGGTLAAGTISRQNLGLSVFEDQPYYLRINNTTQGSSLGANSYHIIGQRIEDVRTFAGKTVTLSIWAASSIAGKQIGVYAIQAFGVGGSAEVPVPAGTGNLITLTSTVTRYNVTFTIPSIASKTIGTGSFLFMGFYLQGGSSQTPVHGLPTITWGGTGNVDVVRMMVNEGPAADFETAGRDISDELRLCQRYYEKSYDLDVVPGTNLGAGYPMGGHGWVVSGIASDDAVIGSSRPFLVPKRSTPIVTTYSPAGLNLTGQAYFFRSVGSGGAGSFALGSSFANTTMIGVSINQTVNTGVECVICWTADAEI